MASALDVQILATLREEVKAMERDVARGSYASIQEFSRLQGELFGLERAAEICKRVISEQDDD